MQNNWINNSIQFPRLIAEIERNGGFTPKLMENLKAAMDLEQDEIIEIIDRACSEWDKIVSNT